MAAGLMFIVANDDGYRREKLGRKWKGSFFALKRYRHRCGRDMFLGQKWTLSSLE